MQKPFALRNITQIAPGELCCPWEFKFDPASISEKARKDKRERQRWIMDSATKHLFYSGFIGASETLRVSKDNPATKVVKA